MKFLIKMVFALQIFCSGFLQSQESKHSVVFVHLGPELPYYLEIAVAQARLFNKDCPMYIIANQFALNNMSVILEYQDVIFIPTESLVKSAEHEIFQRDFPALPYDFWKATSERFLTLDDFIQQYQLTDVFHLENDVMLYVDLNELLPIFQKNYKGIATTFDHDKRCIAGIMYFSIVEISNQLAACFANEARHGHNDMGLIPLCRTKGCPSAIEQLPIIPDTYVKSHPLVASIGHGTNHPELYSNHFEEFQSIFDAAAIGQLFCSMPSQRFVNESCVFDPTVFEYEWIVDDKGRKVPHILFEGKRYRINNLHVHCKQLYRFKS